MIDCNVIGQQCESCNVKKDCTDYNNFHLGYNQGIDKLYDVVTDFLIKNNTELDFNLALQNKILDLKYGKID